MRHHHSKLIEKLSKSLAKWKRDAEAWYKQDTAMFEGLLHMVEANAVRMCLTHQNLINTYTVCFA